MALTEAQARAAAVELVLNHAPGAPPDVRTAAVELLVKSIRSDPLVASVEFADQKVDYASLGANLIRRCGASSILAPWRRPRARVIEAAP